MASIPPPCPRAPPAYLCLDSPRPPADAVGRLLPGQVFLDTYFLGTLDYKKNTIVIPMVQVCPGGAPQSRGGVL